jgi:hypothetical protein
MIAGAACALASCQTVPNVGPRPGESACAYGRRILNEAQRRLDQASATAATVCTLAEYPLGGILNR